MLSLGGLVRSDGLRVVSPKVADLGEAFADVHDEEELSDLAGRRRRSDRSCQLPKTPDPSGS